MRQAFAHDAVLRMAPNADTRAPGAAVTLALCGHWDHEPPCRWPHHTDTDARASPARLLTRFSAPPDEVAAVRRRIDEALADDDRWRVLSSGPEEPHRSRS